MKLGLKREPEVDAHEPVYTNLPETEPKVGEGKKVKSQIMLALLVKVLIAWY